MRSLLFVPADSEKKLARALGSGADILLLDLEDSVAASRKEAGREMTRAFLKARPAGTRAFVRVNPLASELAALDLEAVMRGRPDGIMLPKAAGGDEVRTLDRMLEGLEQANGVPPGATQILPIVTETARAMFTLGTYAGASARLSGLMWGAEDLAADIGALANRRADATYEAPFALARSLCLFAAAAAGVAAVDTVYADFRDSAGFERECLDGARLGFTAKAAIHPDQVAVINRVFTPDAKAVEHAQRIVEAFAKAPEAGVVSLDGMMVDRPHFVAAQRVLARAGRPSR
jgi:citrate lyase subunit beta/citryl-CoA lyase